ncbi:MAG: CCA tRNA nucleotidyltransferase [Phycisphaerae bacterium]
MTGRPSRTTPLTLRQAALRVLRRLRDAGHEALLAGGCVRDMKMNRRPKDYDVATNAHPDQIVAMFRRTRKVGMQFGVVLIGVRQHWIEVATFRVDEDYQDGRRPDHVRFTSAREDAVRRDFTINGMFYDPLARRLIDFVGGEADLKAGLIRAIGRPDRRFAEDHLRMLRAIRFAARFGFKIEPATWQAMRRCAPSVARISSERIQMELQMMLTHPHRADAFSNLHAAGLLQHLWPGAQELLPAVEPIRALLTALPARAGFELSLAALLHRLPARRVQTVCRSLACSNRTTKTSAWLIAHQDALAESDTLSTADLKRLMAQPSFRQLLDLNAAMLRAEGKPPTPHRRILARIRRIPTDQIAPPPFITGDDLIRLGLPPGPRFKQVLYKLYDAQLNGDLHDRASARRLARHLTDQPSERA